MISDSVDQIISRQSLSLGKKEFLIYQPDNFSVTFTKLDLLTLSAIDTLHKLGIPYDSKVILRLCNSLEFVVFYLAIMRMGGIAIPINPTLKLSQISRVVSHSRAKLIITSDNLFDDDTKRHFANIDTLVVSKDYYVSNKHFFIPASSAESAIQNDVAGLASVIYTSGTTGNPKGVALSQQNIIGNAIAISKSITFGFDRMMCVLPMHHTNGQIINLLTPLVSGGSLVLCEAANVFNLSHFWENVSKYQVNVVDSVPSILSLLLNLRFKDKPSLDSLKYVICGAAPLHVNLQKSFEAKYSCKVIQEYGLTEATCVSSMDNVVARRVGSVGRPLSCNEMKIVDDYGNRCSANATGEIMVKGENVMHGYYNDPILTQSVVRDGWLYTGDIGKVDQDGFYYILGRKKDIIIKGGENIYPLDIENVLLAHPSVKECAIVGIPDEVYGESVKAFVVLHNNSRVTDQELIDFCRDFLPSFWCPVQIEFIDEIPRTPSGKVIKSQLV